MRKNIILLIIHLMCALIMGTAFVWSILNTLEIGLIIILGLSTLCWIVPAINNFIDIIEMMESVILKCPKCNKKIQYKNWFVWVLHSPMHWFGKRHTKCHCCGKRSWMKREK